MARAVDSLEVAFSKEVLALSDSSYGFLVSVAGFGIIVGSLINTLIINKINVGMFIGIGTLFVSVGYVIYGFSNTILQASTGFFILAFFTAGANTGFLTFFQNSIPVDMMGRIGSVYSLFNSGFIIIFTTVLGAMAHSLNIKLTVIFGVLFMLILSIILLVIIRLNKAAS